MDASFKDAIRDHLQLKQRNRWIEQTMPLSRYRSNDATAAGGAVGSAALIGTGDVLDPDGPAGWPTAESLGLEGPAALWSPPAEFDWGN